MYKCNHCNITFSGKDDEGIITFKGKMYCKRCEEPVVEILDMHEKVDAVHGAQATLVSNSDNRITTNNYYGGATPDEQIETPYGLFLKSEARLCKKCRQWVPLPFFDAEKGLCDSCIEKECVIAVDEGKSLFEYGLYDKALETFLQCEPICKNREIRAQIHYYIGRCYFEQKQLREALLYFTKSREHIPDSLFFMGQCFNSGDNDVPQNKEKAKDFFLVAAQNGSQMAIDLITEEKRRIKEELEKKRAEEQKRLEAERREREEEEIKRRQAEQRRIEEEQRKREEAERHKREEERKRLEEERRKQEAKKKADDEAKKKAEEERRIKIEQTNLYPVVENGAFGFVDRNGKLVVPCKWTRASYYNEEFAVVSSKGYSDYMYINKEGEIAIPGKWKLAYPFSEGLALVKDNDSKYRFIDKLGNVFLTCDFKIVSPFKGGLSKVVDNHDNYGYIDCRGEVVIPCNWKWIGDFSRKLAPIKDKKGKWGFIDVNGKVVIQPVWDYIYGSGFYDECAIVRSKDKWGVIDRKGNVVVPCKWAGINSFSEGLAPVFRNKKKWGLINTDELEFCGFIDQNGNIMIQPNWISGNSFHDGLAAVKDENNRWGYINIKGQLVIPCKWRKAYDFCNGFAIVNDKGYGIINKSGEIVVPCKFRDINNQVEGLFAVWDASCNQGYVDETGKLVVPCKYKSLSSGFGFNKIIE